MAQSRTIKLLPEVFRTSANKKFLNATMDQLVAEPKLKKIYGYVGRTFSSLYKKTDNYLPEISKARQNYQLEPSIVVRDSKNQPAQYVSYIDLLDQIRHHGGTSEKQSRLFENEYYSFDGLVDFDKIINFNEYYWLEDGPDSVSVFAVKEDENGELIQAVDPNQNFDVTRDFRTGSYQFSGHKVIRNPLIYLARGGTYTFQTNQEDNEFWIQSEPGVRGVKRRTQNISTREVLGVDNNGEDVGTVTFTVPLKTAQDFFINMEKVADVEIATTTHFSDIQGHRLSKVPAGTFDGTYTDVRQLRGKKIIFVNRDTDEVHWTPNGTYDLSNFDSDLFSARVDQDGVAHPEKTHFDYQGSKYDPGALVAPELRFQVWRIEYYPGTDVIVLVPANIEVPVEKKVFVTTGIVHANREYYKEHDGFFKRVPLLTANLDTLYYQDGSESRYVGEFRILDSVDSAIDIERDILGREAYISPNRVAFTNGLRVRFEGNIVPEEYKDKDYYVEGVGTGIRLVDVTNLITPELDTNSEKDYITINRSSLDLNAWSRYNRWFHSDIINQASEYNNTIPLFDQDLRARRPIIEFDPDIALYNHGTVGITPVDLFVSEDAYTLPNNQTNALTDQLEVEGVPVDVNLGIATIYSNIEVTNGMRVVFPDDVDPVVRNKVYGVQFVKINAEATVYKVHLVPEDTVLSQNTSILVLGGINSGNSYWFNGVDWIKASNQKTSVNQPPLFDAFDDVGISFSDSIKYNTSSFAGSQIFGYKIGSGGDDAYLGFPLSYSNFRNIGDIEFQNYFDGDTFTYVDSSTITVKINSGFVHKTLSESEFENKNVWETVVENSRQYQNLTYFSDGQVGSFLIDVSLTQESTIPYLKVFLNNALLKNGTDYVVSTVGEKEHYVVVSNTLAGNDKIDILVYSKDVSAIGSYQVPLNLDFNAQNADFETLTLGQVRNHVKTCLENSFVDSIDLRDNPVSRQGGSILQHSSPVSHSALFLTDSRFNFVNALDHARREYTRFKHKFLETCLSLSNLDQSDQAAGVDLILSTINSIKTKMFPWFYSDMLPHGSEKTVYTYSVLNVNVRNFEISNIFDNTTPSNKAVLIYHNGVQLVYGRDYVFSTTTPSVEITEAANINVDDIISIHEYQSTNGSFVPETPSKLGLYPKYYPEIVSDPTYLTPTTVIIGHDGSITPTFGDHRDSFLLELERRIYNNIKVEHQDELLSIYDVKPGKFRETEYSLEEFNKIQERSFLIWVGTNRLDYTKNLYFKSSNPFSWNYGLHSDREGDRASGSWRAIYRYYYDTETPHVTPWEMFGFSEKPDWWETQYGPAPYTGENLVLWSDVEAGYIAAGPRQGYDARFERPGVTQRIPVDQYGALREPFFLIKDLDTRKMSGSWVVGQMGPVETAWMRSSDYPFAQQLVLALTKPARYFGSLVDIKSYNIDSNVNQMIVASTNQRLKPEDITFTGDIRTGEVKFVASYINWIAEYLVSIGITPNSLLVPVLEDYDINLSYKAAGFTGKNYVKILAEQSTPTSTNESVVLPDENYVIHLNKSSPIFDLIYSAVIVERTPSGFSVQGYDQNNPFFTINKPVRHSGAPAVRVLDESYYVYQVFEQRTTDIPYGYEFTSKQDVVDFLVGYEHYLKGVGFNFDEVEPTLGEVKNWTLSIKEFVFWAKQLWQEGNVLVLSPVANELTVYSADSVVDAIQDAANGTKILDQNFNVVKQNEYTVIRDEDSFTIELPSDKIIGLIKLSLVQFEHVLIFDNRTVFNDIIYQPELGNRQVRLKIVGQKTDEWDGRLTPSGFIYNADNIPSWKAGSDYFKGDIVEYKKQYYTALSNLVATNEFNFSDWKTIKYEDIKTGLLPNFAFNATRGKTYYDVDAAILDPQTNQYSKGLIGFRARPYLGDLSIDDQTQLKFYQGYIKEKGTKNAITALTNSQFNNVTGDISYTEEWALRVGEYGAIETNQFVEAVLDESLIKSNPSTVQFMTSNSESVESDVIGIPLNGVYKKSNRYTGNIALSRSGASSYTDDIPTAGYVRLEDVDYTLFDLSKYYELDSYLSVLGSGSTIWTAKDLKQDWNVYRVDETDNKVIRIENILDGVISVETQDPHELVKNNIIAIKNFDTRFDGFYRVSEILDLRRFVVSYSGAIDGITNIDSEGMLFKLTGQRFDYLTDLIDYTPRHGWKSMANVWIDNATASGWGVYQKSDPWSIGNTLTRATSVVGDQFGSDFAATSNGLFLVVGRSGDNNIVTYTRDSINNDFIESGTSVYPAEAGLTDFGSSIVIGNDYIVVGAPTSYNSKGNVVVYTKDAFGQLVNVQTISGPTIETEFGHSLAISGDDKWLYVGAPGSNNDSGNVYAYRLQNNGQYFLYSTGTISANLSGDAGGFRFGTSIATDSLGEYLLVGATQPNRSLSEITGAAYVYVRGIEHFVGNILGGNTYTTNDSLLANVVVSINGVEKSYGNNYTISANTVSFHANSAPDNGAIISIDTNTFRLVKKFSADDPQALSNFGHSVSFCGDSCHYVIGAPGHDNDDFNSGAAFTFIDQAKTYGSVVGSVANAVVSTGHSIMVNNQTVLLNSAPTMTVTEVASAINSANIAGVSATVESYCLKVVSDSLTEFRKLQITPGVGTAFTDLGLGNVIIQTQKIEHPSPSPNESFGQQVKINSDASALLISSIDATGVRSTTFDSEGTIFDFNTTAFLDQTNNAGAVYLFENLLDIRNTANYPPKFLFAQQFVNTNMEENDEFGATIAFVSNDILVGSTDSIESGSVYIFKNPSGKKGWELVRYQEDSVDPQSLNSIYLYNKKTGQKITSMDWIDPAKGKVLGFAEQELSYKTSTDPAMYNRGSITAVRIDDGYYWNENYVGKVWWDLSQIRYINYEHGNLKFRTANWGKQFPGSEIRVYEWVESSVPPSQYAGPGTPKYPNNDAYVEIAKVDNNTGIIVNMYYFWVADIDTVNPLFRDRNIPTTLISQIIDNPAGYGIPYAALLNKQSLAVYNVSDKLSADNVVIHIDYDLIRNENIIHSEYELVGEGQNTVIPSKIINKMIDSLSGLNAIGSGVPDYTLADSEKYGISVRPRQTMCVDRATAVKQVFEYLNTVLLKYRILDQVNVDGLYSAEPIPLIVEDQWDLIVPLLEDLYYLDTDSLSDGYRVLVEKDSTNSNLWVIYRWDQVNSLWEPNRVQAYRAEEFWTPVDWYADGYSDSTPVDVTVSTYSEFLKLALVADSVVKIQDRGDGDFTLLRINDDLSYDTVAVGNGTMQFLDPLYNLEEYQPGFDANNFDSTRFDQNTNIELRFLLETIYTDILTGDLAVEFNGMFFSFINYLFSEQISLDWVFKSSFISVVHKLRKLSQYPNFIKDNQSYYNEYINEVKPYRTKIREYLLDYEGSDNFTGDVTDFDLPGYYDSNLRLFRSPSGELASDTITWTNSEYNNWNQNNDLEVELVILENAGTGYGQTPEVIFDNTDTGGTGARARAVVNFETEQIEGIELLSPGSGYRTAPRILIGGVGHGAKAYPQMINRKMRGFKTHLKFDRVDYTHSILEWTANTTYTHGSLVSYYDNITGGRDLYVFTGNLSANSGIRFNPEEFQSISTIDVWKANTTYYGNSLVFYREPYRFANVYSAEISFGPNNTIVSGNIANINFANFYIKSGSTITVDYIGTASTPNKGIYTVASVTANSISVVEDTITEQTSGPNIALGSYLPAINTGNLYLVTTPVREALDGVNVNVFTTGMTFTTSATGNGNVDLTELLPARNLLKESLLTIENSWDPVLKPDVANVETRDYTVTLAKANDRIMALYQPDNHSAARDIKQLVPGIDYPGVIIDGVKFDVNINSISGNVIAFTAFTGNTGAITSTDVLEANLANLHAAVGDTIYVLDSAYNEGIYTISSIVSNANILVVGNTFTTEVAGNVTSIYGWTGVDAGVELDSIIASYFDSFGTYANIADYNINGTSFIDVFNSHAPEELVPGSTFDHLNIGVFTNANVSTGSVGYRVVKNMRDENQFTRIAASRTTTLAQDLLIDDNLVYLVDATVLTVPLDLRNKFGVVYINGERIVYYDIDYSNNTLRRFRRGTEGTGAANIHLAGSKVEDASYTQNLPVTGNVYFFDYLESNASITSNVIQFFASNSTIYSTNTGIANLQVLTPAASNIVVISGSAFNSNVFYITSANASHVVTSNVVVNESSGNVITMTFYSNVSPNVANLSTAVTQFITNDPSYNP